MPTFEEQKGKQNKGKEVSPPNYLTLRKKPHQVSDLREESKKLVNRYHVTRLRAEWMGPRLAQKQSNWQ
ncbi:hypothetical protein TREES_T100006822 [Tupaia chinensis]|uniref:Uncharacterized protein n=1 Tax=Tupaia chinensis TaxID=246437 RepID=L9JE03_TUPCH|nr:hypothetical protein TREES_T100006822 [Tupaia chinensis]